MEKDDDNDLPVYNKVAPKDLSNEVEGFACTHWTFNEDLIRINNQIWQDELAFV